MDIVRPTDGARAPGAEVTATVGKITYFESPAEFRRWLATHHATEMELLVGYHKKGAGTPSMTWPMAPAGLKAFEARQEKRSGVYAYENEPKPLDARCEKLFRRDKAAWHYFQAQPPGYRKQAAYWVMSAKKEETRQKRLARLIADSSAGKRI